MTKLKIPPSMKSQVTWASASVAFKILPPTKKVEVVKWTSEFCATGKTFKDGVNNLTRHVQSVVRRTELFNTYFNTPIHPQHQLGIRQLIALLSG